MSLGTVLIGGHGRCGSTLLAYLLGSHPDVKTAGEVMWWVSGNHDGGLGDDLRECVRGHAWGSDAQAECAECRHRDPPAPCPHWGQWPTLGRCSLPPIPSTELYATLRQRMGCSWVVDSSKWGRWYERTIPANPGEYRMLIPYKRPWGQLVSWARRTLGIHPDEMSEASAAEGLKLWLERHEKGLEVVDEFGIPVTAIPYERLPHDPEKTLTPVFRDMGLGWDPRVLDWAHLEHHPLGGSMSTTWLRTNRPERTEVRLDIDSVSTDAGFIRTSMEHPGVLPMMERLDALAAFPYSL